MLWPWTIDLLPLRDGDRNRLEQWQQLRSAGSGLAKRARMIPLASEGWNRSIGQTGGGSPTTVIERRARYEERGLARLTIRERSVRPRIVHHGTIVAET